MTPETAAGSKVATVRILIDEMTLSNTSSLSLDYYYGSVFHNNSGTSLSYWHSSHPLFKLVPSNNFSSPTSYSYHPYYYYYNYLYFNSTAVAELRELSPVYCTVNSQNYIAISLDLYLLSDSLYHLGDHAVNILGNFISNNTNYYIPLVITIPESESRYVLYTQRNIIILSLFIVVSTHS